MTIPPIVVLQSQSKRHNFKRRVYLEADGGLSLRSLGQEPQAKNQSLLKSGATVNRIHYP